MMGTTIPTHLKLKLLNHQHQLLNTHFKFLRYGYGTITLKPKNASTRVVITRASSDGSGGSVEHTTPPVTDRKSSSFGDGYVGLFVRMLGLDNDPLDREQAIDALWKYALGGKKSVDELMKFRGCVNLIVNLLKSESDSTCEAASGLLRIISSDNLYRDSVAESGAIEEIAALLSRSSLTSEVKEQSLCTLWNLSVDEKLRAKIADMDLLQLIIKKLDDEEIKVIEAAGGVLANLALTHSLHNIMVESGVIPKLAKLLKPDIEGSPIIRKEARNALLELAKDDYYKILIMEEGLILVPLIGAAAYKSFKPSLYSWPSLPDGTELKKTSKEPSRYGAAELLLGLNIQDQNADLEEAKLNAFAGRTQQQFLARVGAIEPEPAGPEPLTSQRFTVLPWVDGVARLVLILGLEDELGISRAAEAIAEVAYNEHMRSSFKEAGAVKLLVQLLNHQNDGIKLAATRALGRLSISNDVCQLIEAEGVLYSLLNFLKDSNISKSLTEQTLNILARILDPSKEMKSRFYEGPVNGSKKKIETARSDPDEIPLSQPISREEVFDSAVAARLVEIMKSSSPNLQKKAASVLEFITITETCVDTIISVNIESGLDAVFRNKLLNETEANLDDPQPELRTLELEEAGLAVSAASRLLTKLLDFDSFRLTINNTHFTTLLRKTLASNIPLHNKDWVAACLIKLSSISGPTPLFENPINTEVTLHETIPRLVQQMEASFSQQEEEAAVVELNRIVSEGVVDATRSVASRGGIFPLVRIIERGSERAVEAGLAILYNLSMDSENHAAIVAAGAVPALRRIVLAQGPQWTRALHLLRTLPS